MRIELWQVSLLVIAGIVAADAVVRAIMKRFQLPTLRRKQLKTAGLVMLALIMTMLLWGAWSLVGTSTMANIAAIVSMLIELGALWLAYQAYQETKATRAANTDSDRDGGHLN